MELFKVKWDFRKKDIDLVGEARLLFHSYKKVKGLLGNNLSVSTRYFIINPKGETLCQKSLVINRKSINFLV